MSYSRLSDRIFCRAFSWMKIDEKKSTDTDIVIKNDTAVLLNDIGILIVYFVSSKALP
jgi:hypothetical protein